ncbi:AlpA family phage regulatory protein [Cronobacter sakazakii]|uniref:helix-turn-helix transcriptional regulator n=1 Tax=Cronobacter sakazakii TaxID=28141 RepID=UPI0019093B51|nr:AlpA family phage regulatory protein [Cronobacter sakazakii]MBK4112391.1 AlpA family phage regulatory protein [Cronobacter sakazakii]
MKRAYGKKELLEVVPLSISTIDALEKKGEFPKRWYITDKRCAWDADEISEWLEERKAKSPSVFGGKKPPVEQRVFRQVSSAA